MSESREIAKQLLHPVSLIALLIVLGLFALIGASVFGLEGDVISKMGERQFARGLITYLFAVATIGTAVVLVVAALTGATKTKEEFDRGKDVLSLLLGVFGTIIGFYFGTEVSAGDRQDDLSITPLLLSAETVDVGGSFELTAFISGGDSPYEFSVTVGDAVVAQDQPVPLDGWIIATITLPAAVEPGTEEVLLIVEDSVRIREEIEEEIEVTEPADP